MVDSMCAQRVSPKSAWKISELYISCKMKYEYRDKNHYWENPFYTVSVKMCFLLLIKHNEDMLTLTFWGNLISGRKERKQNDFWTTLKVFGIEHSITSYCTGHILYFLRRILMLLLQKRLFVLFYSIHTASYHSNHSIIHMQNNINNQKMMLYSCMILGLSRNMVCISTARGRMRSADAPLSLPLCPAAVWLEER